MRAGQEPKEPKEAVRCGDLAPRGGRADACENVCVSRTFEVCSDRSGWRSWCSAVWRAMADVSVPFERVGMVIETVGSSAAAGALL